MSVNCTASAGELDCLVVLWQEAELGVEALRLSEILELISKRRSLDGEPEPALTTVSTYLRSAVAKGLLEEVRLDHAGKLTRLKADSSRGVLSKTRSPNTAHRAAVSASDAFRQTLLAITKSYPEKERLTLLVDIAQVLGVPASVTSQLNTWVNKQRKPR
jgi:hypothetical protein